MSGAGDKLGAAAVQAAGFGRIREDHRAEIAEDYVELIAMLMSADDEWVHLYDPADHQVLSVPYTDLVGLEAIEGPS